MYLGGARFAKALTWTCSGGERRKPKQEPCLHGPRNAGENPLWRWGGGPETTIRWEDHDQHVAQLRGVDIGRNRSSDRMLRQRANSQVRLHPAPATGPGRRARRSARLRDAGVRSNSGLLPQAGAFGRAVHRPVAVREQRLREAGVALHGSRGLPARARVLRPAIASPWRHLLAATDLSRRWNQHVSRLCRRHPVPTTRIDLSVDRQRRRWP
jgi:hypothetical protein